MQFRIPNTGFISAPADKLYNNIPLSPRQNHEYPPIPY